MCAWMYTEFIHTGLGFWMQICMLYAHSEVLTYTQAKYDEMTQKEREIAQKSDAEQIQEIMADEVLSA